MFSTLGLAYYIIKYDGFYKVFHHKLFQYLLNFVHITQKV